MANIKLEVSSTPVVVSAHMRSEPITDIDYPEVVASADVTVSIHIEVEVGL